MVAGNGRRWWLAAAVAPTVLIACTPSAHTTGSGAGSTENAPTSERTSSSPAAAEPASSAAVPVLSATTTAARLPVALSRLVAVRLGDRILIIGGLNAHDQTTDRIENFDPAADSVAAAGQLPVPTHDAAAGVVAGEAIVAGGGSAASIDTVQVVHPDGTTRTAGHLPQPRSDDSMAIDDDTAYVVGGYDGRSELPDVLATTNGTTFRRVGSLAETVRYAAAYASSGSVWVFGGEHHGSEIADVQRVDIATGTAEVVAKLPHPLAHESAVVVGNTVLLVGGLDGGTPLNAVYAFDPVRDTINQVGSLPSPVCDAAAVAFGDAAYLIGGETLTAQGSRAPMAAIVRLTLQRSSPR